MTYRPYFTASSTDENNPTVNTISAEYEPLPPFTVTVQHIQEGGSISFSVENWFENANHDGFRAQENEEQLLAVYFDVPSSGSGTFMTTAEISDKLVIKGSIKKPMPLNRLGMVLKKEGYTQKCLGGKVRGWLVRERDADEINANRRINAKP